jgi:hypothetical protein
METYSTDWYIIETCCGISIIGSFSMITFLLGFEMKR